MGHKKGAGRCRSSEAGATLVEYAAVLGFASIVAVVLVAAVGQQAVKFFQDVAGLFA